MDFCYFGMERISLLENLIYISQSCYCCGEHSQLTSNQTYELVYQPSPIKPLVMWTGQPWTGPVCSPVSDQTSQTLRLCAADAATFQLHNSWPT